MIKERYYFEIRFEKELGKKIKEFCTENKISLSQLAEEAFRFTARLHDAGKVPFVRRSAFYGRKDKDNIFSPMIILKADVHEMVRNFAFAYRQSMAETLRISLEMFLEAAESDFSKLEDNIHYYNAPTLTIKQVTAFLIPAFPPGIPPQNYIHYTYFYP